MNCIGLKTRGDEEKLPAGSSKLFGNPDVWEDFVWPSITVEGEDYDLTFMGQINCADAAEYDLDGLLPKTGMLYFFYDLDGLPGQPSDENAARVLYYGGDGEKLREMVLTDETGVSIAFAEQKIKFECAAEDFPSGDEPTHLLLGRPPLDCGMDACIQGYQMLLQLDSFETEDAAICFADGGVLCFFIEPQKLKALDFSDVRIMQSRK